MLGRFSPSDFSDPSKLNRAEAAYYAAYYAAEQALRINALPSVHTANLDAERYRKLRNADPDNGPHVVTTRLNDWGRWVEDVLIGEDLDKHIDSMDLPNSGEG